MVYIPHSGENAEKIEGILSAAQKRFGQYGLEKTTMKEIAADLGMSKAALYYYFPDKEGLFKAVVEMEQDEFFQAVKQVHEVTSDPIVMLKEYARLRLKYFKTLFNLSRLRIEEFSFMKPMLLDTLNEFRFREGELIKDIITSGNEMGVFHVENPAETATLYIELIKGLRMVLIHKKDIFYIEPEEFSSLERKMSMFTDIFIRGLAYKN